MKNVIKTVFILIIINTLAYSNDKSNIIDYEKVKNMFYMKSALFIDVRPMKAYKKGTIAGSLNIPLRKLIKNKQFLPIKKSAKIITFCQGPESKMADELAIKIQELGYLNVYVYKGGYPQWKKEKQPIMGIIKKCKKQNNLYIPKNPAVLISGANIHLGMDASDGQIDQFWLTELINKDITPKNIQLIDVRKASQYKNGHIKGAINIRWNSDLNKINYNKFPENKLIVFYCNTGMQSMDARSTLSGKLAKRVFYLDANIKCEEGKCELEPNEDIE